MQLLVDTHTHTILSGHAYSTLDENARAAHKKGLEGFVCSDHGPVMEGGAIGYAIPILTQAPDYIEGVRVFAGTEVDVMPDHSLGLREEFLSKTDFAIASLHDIVYGAGNCESPTDAMIAALQNPYIDTIGHPGNPLFQVDHEAVVLAAKKLNKVIEINNHSFHHRPGSKENCTKVARLCMKHDVRITVSSDAHLCYRIGVFDNAVQMLEEVGFPEELIISRNLSAFDAYLEERKKRLQG